MNQLALTFAGALALTASATAQTPTRGVAAFNGPITYAGTYHAASGTFTPAAPGMNRGVSNAIYRNDARPGSFYNMVDGRTIIDEGRIPSTTSPTVVGTQDSYTLTNIQIGYATDATDPMAGGTGLTVELNLYENFATCGLLETTDAALATLTIPNLPGSANGPGMGAFAFIVDVDLTGLGICMRADGDGVYSDGTSDLFGWSFQVVDPADATAAGALLAGDPNVALNGDGTAFQNPATVPATGLDTVDAWRNISATGALNCFFFGGYPTAPFSSYHLVIESDLSGNCIGCGFGDDRFEMNDDAMSAAPIAVDSYSGLVSDVNDDWYSYTVAPGGSLTVDIFFVDATSDLDLRIFDAATGVQLDSSTSVNDTEQVSVGNCDTANSLDVNIRVQNFSGICNEYDMVLTEAALAADDSFEDNDTCADRVPLPLGVTEGLVVRPYCGNGTTEDSDYYSIVLLPGETLNVDVLFTDAITDIDVVLYDVTTSCPGTTLDTGFTTTDNESVETTNNGMAPIEVAVRVDYFSGGVGQYAMVATVGENNLSSVICLGVDNSVGNGARLTALGDPAAAANNVTLNVAGLPLNSLGYFIVSQDINLVANPGGSAGNICIASLAIGRYNGNVQNSTTLGSVSFSPDLTAIPIISGGSAGTSAAMTGDTYNFQYWYRDMNGMGMATSNFSDAVGITFQ